MTKIIWKKNYNTGVEQIDRQHSFLVNRTNELRELKSYNEEDSNLYPILLLLVSYAQFHFDYEKSYLDKLNYFETEEYSAEHEKFIKTIDDFNELYINGLADINENLLNYLNEWLITHILGKDTIFLKELFKKGENNGD